MALLWPMGSPQSHLGCSSERKGLHTIHSHQYSLSFTVNLTMCTSNSKIRGISLLALIALSYYLKRGNRGGSPFSDTTTVTGKNSPNVFTFEEYKAEEPSSATNLKII